MKTALIIIGIIIFIVILANMWAALKISGDISREEEKRELEDYFTKHSKDNKDQLK